MPDHTGAISESGRGDSPKIASFSAPPSDCESTVMVSVRPECLLWQMAPGDRSRQHPCPDLPTRVESRGQPPARHPFVPRDAPEPLPEPA